MHTLARILILFAVLVSFAYIVGCFYSTSFNPAKWPDDVRVVVAIIVSIFSFCLFVITCIVVLPPPNTGEPGKYVPSDKFGPGSHPLDGTAAYIHTDKTLQNNE